MTAALLFFGLALVMAGVAVWLWLSDPETLRRFARAERDLHAVRRSREVAEIKREMRNDALRLRRDLERELRDVDP